MSSIVDISEILLRMGLSSSVTEEQRAMVNLALTDAESAVKKFIRYDPVYKEHTEFHPQQPFQSQISRGIWEVMEQRAVLRQVSESATNEMQLQHLPVRGVVAVYVDYDGRSQSRPTSFGPETLKTQGQDYWPNYDGFDSEGNKICRDGVIRTIGLWPTTPGTIKIVYTAGYTAEELAGSDNIIDAHSLAEAVAIEAMRRMRLMDLQKSGAKGLPAGIMTSENLGQYSYSISPITLERMLGGDLMGDTKEKLSEFVNWGISLGS